MIVGISINADNALALTTYGQGARRQGVAVEIQQPMVIVSTVRVNDGTTCVVALQSEAVWSPRVSSDSETAVLTIKAPRVVSAWDGTDKGSDMHS